MTDHPKISCIIDGHTAQVSPGATIIEAAATVGVAIPRFCYHKLLKPYGGCRMCFVLITKTSTLDPRPNPKPQPACLATVLDGMEIDTKSDKLKDIRKAIIEFTLINHPLDCPICDKGGECDLQDLSYLYGPEDSRLCDKKMFRPHHNLSSLIVLDYNRCILCKRCVRWTEEIADDDRLVYIERGAHTEIGTFNNRPFMSRFSGMTIELCPVGALLSKVFRFKARAWELKTSFSTCTECSNGCAVRGQTRNDRLMRVLSPTDSVDNGAFICDRERFSHDYLDHPDRIVSPMNRRGDHFEKISWEEASSVFAERFKKCVQTDGPRAIAAVTDPSETIESLWSFKRFFRDILGAPRIEHAPAPLGIDPDDADSLFSRLTSFEHALISNNLVIWNSDPFDEAPVFGLQLKLAWEKKEIDGIAINPLKSFLGRKHFDERVLPPHRLPVVLAAMASILAPRLSKLPDNLRPAVESARRVAPGALENENSAAKKAIEHLVQPDSVLIIGLSALVSRPKEIAALILISELREKIIGEPLRILPLMRHANSLAALTFGLRTQLMSGAKGPGHVGFTGESVLDWPREIEKGKLKCVFADGDGIIDMIGTSGLNSFDRLQFLTVASDFLTPLSSRADLILPRLSPFENSGTLVSTDGSIGRLDRIITHPGGAWALEHFFGESAVAIGVDLPIERSALRKQIADEIHAFKPILNKTGGRIQWEFKVPNRIGEMKHAFDPLDITAKNRFGVLIAETIFQHDSKGQHQPHVAAMPEDFACGMNRLDAERLGIKGGDEVRLIGEPLDLKAKVKIINVPEGYVLLPAGFMDHPLSDLGVFANPDIRLSIEKVTETANIAR